MREVRTLVERTHSRARSGLRDVGLREIVNNGRTVLENGVLLIPGEPAPPFLLRQSGPDLVQIPDEPCDVCGKPFVDGFRLLVIPCLFGHIRREKRAPSPHWINVMAELVEFARMNGLGNKILVIDTETGERSTAVRVGPRGDLGPGRWSPDGARIAYRLTVYQVDPAKVHPGQIDSVWCSGSPPSPR